MKIKTNKKERWHMKNENRNMKENVLQEIMYHKLICYGIIVFFAKGTLIMSDRIPTLNALLNKISSTDAIYYTLSVMLLLEVITFLTYGAFKSMKKKKEEKERGLIKEGFSEGFSKGFKKGQMDNND
ncbi:hypothetical protein RNW67_004604 [Salmonella enterica]|nr:hypothetical protein [Salmonella enterica]